MSSSGNEAVGRPLVADTVSDRRDVNLSRHRWSERAIPGPGSPGSVYMSAVQLRPSPLDVTEIDFEAGNAELEPTAAEARVAWALDLFAPHIVLSSSFGAQAAVLLHMVTRQWPEIPVVVVDTGYLFPETYRFVDELTQRLSLNLKVYRWQPRARPGRRRAGASCGSRGGRDRALQPHEQGRAHAAGARRARRTRLDRRPAPVTGHVPPPPRRPRASRTAISRSTRSSTGTTSTSTTTSRATTCRIIRSGSRVRLDRRLAHVGQADRRRGGGGDPLLRAEARVRPARVVEPGRTRDAPDGSG